ncbi:hypothetical protein [Allokutzneria oryzae]|uniref:PQQ-binding-like beta-propeller repeat protein n=1 Tax=Allokutzneria oryzae TaxID=1378989 RepID=A0ABV5ZXW8_9PSEU
MPVRRASVLVCTNGERVTGYDAKTAQQLWTLPDQAANRVAPSSITVAWHGALYGKVGGGPIVLDPFWVSRYAGIAVDKNGTPKAYPVNK